MKTRNIIIAASLFATIVTQSCTKEDSLIEGEGTITTETLVLEDFSGITIEGPDNVIISYGAEQKVEVTGHPNIISRIQTDVSNGTWQMSLENGNYGHYELTYYLTLPTIEKVGNTGSGNVSITDPMETTNLDILLNGSGSFFGFPLSAQNCQVDIIGSGNCEVTANQELDVIIEGSGSVFYKGTPTIKEHITGSGRLVNSN